MTQPADLGQLELVRHWRVAIEREMRPRPVAILEVRGKDRREVSFVEHDHALRTLTPNGSISRLTNAASGGERYPSANLPTLTHQMAAPAPVSRIPVAIANPVA